ncbi:MAG: hypothetical protein Q4G11_07530, partial [Gallicola sp.]|nr:hypothetical protein [Gallicola sp.]
MDPSATPKYVLAAEADPTQTFFKVIYNFDQAAFDAAVQKFKTDNAAILAETVETVTADDKPALDKALAEYAVLPKDVQDALATEKQLLDDLAAALNKTNKDALTTAVGEADTVKA